jgi:hypothetical protein
VHDGLRSPADVRSVIYQLATQFAVCSMWFSSLPGPTWPNRMFVHAASSAGLDHSPTLSEMIEWVTESNYSFEFPQRPIAASVAYLSQIIDVARPGARADEKSTNAMIWELRQCAPATRLRRC